jgi:hypothetical protein
VECATYLLLFALAHLRGCGAHLAAEESGTIVLASLGEPRRHASLSVVFRHGDASAPVNAAAVDFRWNPQRDGSPPEWASRKSFLIGDSGAGAKLEWATGAGELSLKPRRHSIQLEWKAMLR